MKIPFSPPYIDKDVIIEVTNTLTSGWITTGPKVKALEKEISAYTRIPHIICVNSWTSGAIMILKWLGITEGDEVIIPAYTYCATALAVLHCGAKPVMVDVADDFNISSDAIKKAITSHTKAIIPVDFAGWPCDIDKIREIVCDKKVRKLFVPDSEVQAKINRIMIISDAAHSFGAIKGGSSSASMSDISIFSLHAVKNLTTAEGGVICLNLPSQFDTAKTKIQLKMMSLNGQTKDALAKSRAGSWKYDIVMQGFKYNMPDICAAIGLAQIRKIVILLNERRRVFDRFTKILKKEEWIQLPPQDTKEKSSSYHIYALRIKGINENQRDKIIEELTNLGVSVNVHFIPLPMLTLFRELGYQIKDYPVSYDNYSREISLPIYPQLTNKQIDFIIKCLIDSYQKVLTDGD